VRNERRRADVTVRSLSPRLHRKLAVVIRRDKRLHTGLNDVFRALKGLSGT
jgi:hypothetical protein